MGKQINYLSLSDLKKELKTLDHKELTSIIVNSYKLNNEVKQQLSVKFNREDMVERLFHKYKKQIVDEFFPDKGFGKMRLSHAKKAISTYKKLTDDQEGTLELMLIYLETGVSFTNTYGEIDERFYNSMSSMFDKVTDHCQKEAIVFNKYQTRLKEMVENTEGIGWGFHDELSDIFYSKMA
ncbi:DUF6155 family protein [Halobacillus shinanisalinarum]|uniref:DUF6155 family protein n=1 Tax=Halobacillus shinanisalinarum TaxID=2932258 RepID=A0ABY4H5Q2_9BACI|nr:DUF6155 family protein [Halobacillus shinanisalinarum]UOQ95459.1 DUF6155 family protein [Halobacillus shinanisalinarum]